MNTGVRFQAIELHRSTLHKSAAPTRTAGGEEGGHAVPGAAAPRPTNTARGPSQPRPRSARVSVKQSGINGTPKVVGHKTNTGATRVPGSHTEPYTLSATLLRDRSMIGLCTEGKIFPVVLWHSSTQTRHAMHIMCSIQPFVRACFGRKMLVQSTLGIICWGDDHSMQSEERVDDIRSTEVLGALQEEAHALLRPLPCSCELKVLLHLDGTGLL